VSNDTADDTDDQHTTEYTEAADRYQTCERGRPHRHRIDWSSASVADVDLDAPAVALSATCPNCGTEAIAEIHGGAAGRVWIDPNPPEVRALLDDLESDTEPASGSGVGR